MKRLILILALLTALPAAAQTVLITGQVKDANGSLYINGSGVVALVPSGQSWVFGGTNPVNSPVPIAQLDSSGRFSVILTDTSLISATPPGPLANWQFSFCSNPALTSGTPICFTMTPMALTAPQDISAIIQPQAAILPVSDGGGGTITGVTAGSGLQGGGVTGNVALSLLTTCAPAQVLQWNGTLWACASVGTGNVSTAPVSSQPIVQPVSTTFSADSLAFWRIVTPSWNWQQSPADDLSSAGAGKTIHLTPCPKGIDTASAANFYIYRVYISTVGTPEAALVTGGTCTGGAATGTIIVTTVNAHTAGYTVGSSTSGIQEAWNDAWVNDTGTAPNANSQAGPYVKLSADTLYNIYSSIYLRGRGGILDGTGGLLTCSTRDRCIYIGTTQANPQVNHHKLLTLSGTSTLNVAGVTVSGASASSGTYTITTGSSHTFQVGDTLDCEIYSQTFNSHFVSPAVFPTSGTTITLQFGSATTASGGYTFGFCNILNTFIEDNSDHVAITDLNIFQSSPAGTGTFSYGIVNDNDQALQLDRPSNRSSQVINNSATWPMGAFLYERNDQGNDGITNIHGGEFTNVNCGTAGGNGFVVADTVCQGFPVYGFRYFGGLQPSTFTNVYMDAGTVDPLYGLQAGMGYLVQGRDARFVGMFPGGGRFPQFPCPAGANTRNYWIVPRTGAGFAAMVYIGQAVACGAGNITLQWPAFFATGVTPTYDILVTVGTGGTIPFGTGNFQIASLNSGSCTSSGMCSFVDTQAAATSYTVTNQNSGVNTWFMPSSIDIYGGTSVTLDSIQDASGITSMEGLLVPSVIANKCKSSGVASVGSPIWILCWSSDNNAQGGAGTIASLIQSTDNSGGPVANSKGRFNFGKQITPPNDIITIQDSNFTKTSSTAGMRPANDANDCALGMDTATGLNIRCQSTISFNIGSVPTGSNWTLRQSSTLFSTTTPINATTGYQIGGTAPLNHCLLGNGTNYIDSSTCGGGSTVNVNGSPITTPNFNFTTPAAGANGINVTWQVATSNVSAEVVGDGNAGHCLSGTGTYVACSGGISGLGVGQRAVPNTSSTLANSGPTFYTEKLPGATWDARLLYCLTNAAALNSLPGTCDMSAETANTSSATAANGVVAGNGQLIILPPVTLTLGNTFFFNITGNNSGFICPTWWSCVIDASNNGSAGTFAISGTKSYVYGVKYIGGRLNKQSGNEIVVTGINDWVYGNWSVNAGQDAILLSSGANQSVVHYNIIDQSGSAAILANDNSNSLTTEHNDIGYNLTRDANVNFNQNTQGTIGAGCSATNCQDGGVGVPPTAHLADYNSFHDNIILNQYFAAGDCNNPNFGTLNISGWSGSGTTSITFTYTTTQPNGGLPVVGQTITGASFAVSGLNANATVTASTTTMITATYASTVTGGTGTGTITYTPTTTDTGCSEGIQTTDAVWYAQVKNNRIFNASKEGIAFDGVGVQVTGNYCESCGLHVIGGSTSGAYAWEKSTQVQASPGYVGDTVIADNEATNTTSTALRYCTLVQFSGNGGNYTFQNAVISNNVCEGAGGSGGFTSGITLNAANLKNVNGVGAATVTMKNVRVTGNTVSGNITTPFNPNSYTNITGVARLTGNGLNSSTDTAPVANDVVCFDANLQPEADCGTPGTNIVTGVTTGGGLILSGHNVGMLNTCTSAQVLQWSGTAWVCGPGVASGTNNAAVIYTSNTTIGATNVPTANGNYVLSASVTTSASATPGLNLPGVPFDVESGASPAVTGSSSGSTSPNTTRGSVFQMTNNTTSTGATIAQAGSAGFGTNFHFAAMNTGTVIATLTPSTSTINGGSAMKFVAKVSGHSPEGAIWYSDNANYWGFEFLPVDANGFLAAEGFNVATSCTTCVTSSSPGVGLAHFAGSTQAVTSSAVNLASADVSGILPLANMTQLFQTNAQTATYQVLTTDFADCKTIPVASGTFTVTLVASTSQPANGQCVIIINYGSGVVTVARSGQNLNGGTTSLTIPAGSASAANGMYVVSDGTNYIAQPWTIGAGVTSVNTLTGAVAIEAATAGQVAISGGPTAALTGAADLTYATHTFSGTANTIFDLSAATGTAAFKLPSTTTNTASAAGVLTYDSTNSNYHANSGADSLVGVVPTASIPTNGHIIDASVVSGKLLLHDSLLVTANEVNASSPGAGVAHFAGSTQTVTSSTVATGDIAANAVTSAKMYSGAGSRSIGWAFGDVATGSALTTSEVGYITLPHNWATCTISGWHIMADAGTVTIKTARVATGGTALPTIGSNSISTSGVALASGTLVNSTTVTDFTSTTLSAGDTLGFFITAVATAKQITFQIDCDQ